MLELAHVQGIFVLRLDREPGHVDRLCSEYGRDVSAQLPAFIEGEEGLNGIHRVEPDTGIGSAEVRVAVVEVIVVTAVSAADRKQELLIQGSGHGLARCAERQFGSDLGDVWIFLERIVVVDAADPQVPRVYAFADVAGAPEAEQATAFFFYRSGDFFFELEAGNVLVPGALEPGAGNTVVKVLASWPSADAGPQIDEKGLFGLG